MVISKDNSCKIWSLVMIGVLLLAAQQAWAGTNITNKGNKLLLTSKNNKIITKANTVQTKVGVQDLVVAPKYLPQNKKKRYVGLNFSFISEMIKNNNTSFAQGYGKNIYAKNPLMYGIFLGNEFNDRFGIEFAYEAQRKKKQQTELTAGDQFPGNVVVAAGEYYVLETKSFTQHMQAALFINLYTFKSKPHINIWSQLGASYTQVQAEQYVIDNEEDGLPLPADIEASRRTFKAWKLIPMAKLGINYEWTNNIGFSAMASWRQLSLLKVKSKEFPNGNTEIKLKDGISCAVGVYYRF